MQQKGRSAIHNIAIFGAMLVVTMSFVSNTYAQPAKIGFLLKTMQEERYQRDKADFEKKAKALGAEVMFDSANNDESTQLAKFESMLAEGCQVIVLQPVNTKTAGNMVRIANNEGVKVIGYDSMLTNGPLDLMVMQDSLTVGRLQAEEMVRWFEKQKGKIEGNVVLIKGHPYDNNAIRMSAEAEKIIKNHPELKLIENDQSPDKSFWHEGWSSDLAMETAERLLATYNHKIDALICNNSGLAKGVIAALEPRGLADSEKVFVAGSDADLVNIQYIAQGKQTVEIWKKITPLAETAAEIAVQLAQAPDKNPVELAFEFIRKDSQNYRYDDIPNEYMENQPGYKGVPTLITPVVLITKDNIDDTVIAEGFYTKEQVYDK